MDPIKIADETRNQATAVLLGELNKNYRNAVESIDWALETIGEQVVDVNRGGQKGMHGFIAEVAETGVANAREMLEGKDPSTIWVNDNGPNDLVRNGVAIQQKFVNSGGKFSLNAVAMHLKTYEDYVSDGGRYQIPKDHYASVQKLLGMSEAEASKLPSSGDGLTYKDWKYVHEFFDKEKVDINDLEPSHLSYKDVQRGTYKETLAREKESYSSSTFKQGAKTVFVSAAIGGGISFAGAVSRRLHGGRKLGDLNEEDWVGIARETGIGVVKSSATSASVFMLTRLTLTPAAAAGAIASSAVGVADQAFKLRSGELGEVEFIENSERLCLDASVAALGSMIGQAVIPIPVLGAVIGSAVASVMYQSAKDGLSEREAELVARYARQQRELDAELEAKYGAFLNDLAVSMARYLELLDRAFDPDPAVAFDGSIALAKEVGVAPEDILDSREKADAYFLD